MFAPLSFFVMAVSSPLVLIGADKPWLIVSPAVSVTLPEVLASGPLMVMGPLAVNVWLPVVVATPFALTTMLLPLPALVMKERFFAPWLSGAFVPTVMLPA